MKPQWVSYPNNLKQRKEIKVIIAVKAVQVKKATSVTLVLLVIPITNSAIVPVQLFHLKRKEL